MQCDENQTHQSQVPTPQPEWLCDRDRVSLASLLHSVPWRDHYEDEVKDAYKAPSAVSVGTKKWHPLLEQKSLPGKVEVVHWLLKT